MLLSACCRQQQLRRELRRAVYYLLSVTDAPQEAELRQALQTIQDEFLPVKENIMTLLEHLEKRGGKRGQYLGKTKTRIRLLSSAFPEFSPADADRVCKLPDELLDELTDAVAERHTWVEIESILRQADDA